jgi:signal transduction histidine kinase
MTQTKQIKASAELTPIADFANAWGVSEKTIANWCEFTYQAFEIVLPSSGSLPDWGVQLLTLCAKHVSQKANLYFADTGEKRRLKGSEFIAKIRQLRKEGHFQDFQKFQNFQKFQALAPAAELEDDLLAEVGALTREGDQRIAQIKQAIEQREEQQITELAEFVEDSDHRMLSKLTARLQISKLLKATSDQPPRIDDAIDVAYQIQEIANDLAAP